jgi:hypothetical protein
MCRRWRAGREGTPMLKVVHEEAEPNEASGSVLDEIVREASRQMLAVALQAEVSAYIDALPRRSMRMVTRWWSATVITTNAR